MTAELSLSVTRACLAFADAQNCYDDVIGDFSRLTSAITLVWGW